MTIIAKVVAGSEKSMIDVVRLIRTYWFLAVPGFFVLRFFYYRYASPLRKYPGPFLASGSRAWKVWSTYGGHTETDHIKIHEKYGRIVRIAPNELSFSSPQAAREILAAGKGFHKTDFYRVFPPPENPDIFTETDEAKHARLKRHASAPYGMASMQRLTPFIEETESLLLKKLDRMCQHADRYCDLGKYLHYFAFDVLGEVAFSRKFGFLDAGYDIEGAIKTIDDMQWYDGIMGQIPEWDYFFRRNPLWKMIPGIQGSMLLITRMALDEMAKRRKLGANQIDRIDLLGSLMTANEKSPDVFGEGDVFAIAHGAIFAGSDSTASTMQSFCHFVLRDPRIHARLRSELDAAAAAGTLSAMPQWTEAQSLPYFQACLKEAMRLRPAVGLNMTRLVPEHGATIDGVALPGGTRLALNAWVLHRDVGTFGRDSKVFEPERWLEGDSKNMERSMHQFGGGAHLCIGKNLALLEMNKILPLIFRTYDMELVHAEEDLKHHSTFFVVQEGLEVRIKRRVDKCY